MTVSLTLLCAPNAGTRWSFGPMGITSTASVKARGSRQTVGANDPNCPAARYQTSPFLVTPGLQWAMPVATEWPITVSLESAGQS